MKVHFLAPLLFACSALAVDIVSLPNLSKDELQARQDFAIYRQAEKAKVMAGELASQMQKVMADWTRQGEAFMRPLPQVPEQALPPEPEASNDTIIDSTQGLYFDSQNSTMSYLGQVRLRDPRLHLDCQHLFIQLEQREVKEEQKAETLPQVPKGGEEKASLTSTDSPPLPQSESEPIEQPEQAAPVIDEASEPSPAVMTAKEVFVDMNQKRLYAIGDVVEIKHSQGEIRATGDKPIIMVDDEEGLIYVRGKHIEGFSVDETGAKSQFATECYLLFELESDSLLLAKNNKIQTPRGDIASKGLLRIRLQAAPEQKVAGDKDFKLNRAYSGLSYVTAKDDVVVSGVQADGTPFHMTGDLLSYDARLGEFIMTGDQCHLDSAEQKMQLKGGAMARLYPDGSMKLKGADIAGTYQRPSRTHEGLLNGRFQTRDEMNMVADNGKLYCPNGLIAKDEEMDFSCSHEVVIEFERDLSEPVTKTSSDAVVLPDLALTRIKGMSHLYARGDIQAKGVGEFDIYLQGEELEANLIDGTARVESKPSQWAQFTYQGAQLKARSQDEAADIRLLANGDMKIVGDVIEGYMPARENRASYAFETKESLYLNNAKSLLVMEYPVRMQSNQGVFSSQGGMVASLRRGETEENAERGFARHNFNFVGLDWAEAPSDSAFQSEQMSMQCDGLMRVFMNAEDEPKGKDAMLSGLKSAEAHDAVRLIAKDAEGVLYRATGDHLNMDGKLGTKVLTGSRVTLSSGKKEHEATGAGAQVYVDEKNNVSIRGERQTSVVTDVAEQFGRSPKPAPKKSKP